MPLCATHRLLRRVDKNPLFFLPALPCTISEQKRQNTPNRTYSHIPRAARKRKPRPPKQTESRQIRKNNENNRQTDNRNTRKAPKTGRIRFSPAYLAICLSFGILPQARAGHTYFGINYQYYRDFAENKGKFAVGAKDIEVTTKKGSWSANR